MNCEKCGLPLSNPQMVGPDFPPICQCRLAEALERIVQFSKTEGGKAFLASLAGPAEEKKP